MKTPARAPKANAYCERLVGTIRRECLDFLIPFNDGHLKRILREHARHYNRGRPHSARGPELPEPPQARVPAGPHGHKLPDGLSRYINARSWRPTPRILAGEEGRMMAD
ncbi:MAG TPA: integrase core domain-containing protein [Bryobacteraceae bacterium]|nr:integrase core domain-containing protein [Bryobacteraceae bacterium]